ELVVARARLSRGGLETGAQRGGAALPREAHEASGEGGVLGALGESARGLLDEGAVARATHLPIRAGGARRRERQAPDRQQETATHSLKDTPKKKPTPGAAPLRHRGPTEANRMTTRLGVTRDSKEARDPEPSLADVVAKEALMLAGHALE